MFGVSKVKIKVGGKKVQQGEGIKAIIRWTNFPNSRVGDLKWVTKIEVRIHFTFELKKKKKNPRK